MYFLLQIILSVISGVIGVVLTIIFQRKFMLYDLKREVLIQFVENRFNIRGDEFTKALNKIHAVYTNNLDVIKAVDDFHRLILGKSISTDSANQKLYQIYLMMCNSIKIKPMSETQFLMPFNVKN